MTKLSIQTAGKKGAPRIHKNIYGQFAEHLGRCIYDGFWVGENSKIPNVRGIRSDLIAAFKKIKVPVLRWPGGCFADEYHWKDGIGPPQDRPTVINTHWGGVTEDNRFGTHEFMDLCEQLGTEPYICGNVGSGTVREISEWVEYLNFGGTSPMSSLRAKNGRKEAWAVKYFGVGNENWGCGGNMRAEYYADLYWQFQTYCRNYPGKPLYKIAGGANNEDYAWTEALMKSWKARCGAWAPGMNGLSLHRYITSWDPKFKRGRAAEFKEEGWAWVMEQSFAFEAMIKKHEAIMDKYDPEKKVAIIFDEWGTWFDVEEGSNPGFLYQQNTLRDAVSAAIVLNIFNAHAERLQMANIAQAVNVLQAMALTDKEKMLLTPTYHVFEMYLPHHDACLLESRFVEMPVYKQGKMRMPALSASASQDDSGKLCLTLANSDPIKGHALQVAFKAFAPKNIKARILTAGQMQAHNTFESPENVVPRPFKALKLETKGLNLELPPACVLAIELN